MGFDVAQTLENLGIEAEASGGEFRSMCPMHAERTGRPDVHPSWYINGTTGLHLCFSCGYRGSLLSLVRDLRGLDSAQAQAWLVEERSELDLDQIRERLDRVNRFSTSRSPFLPESSLASFTDPPDWALERRRVSLEGTRSFGVRWDPGNHSWILPIRDRFSHRLMGWQVKGQDTRLFRNRPTGVKKARTLFGWERLTDDVECVWVVESPLDAVVLHGVGITAVATFGAIVSDTQCSMLDAIPKVVCAFDQDASGEKAAQFVRERVTTDVFVVSLPSGCKDPGDCDRSQLLSLTPTHSILL